MLAINETFASGRTEPESVFIAWLLWQPQGADLAGEALKEVRKLSRYESRHPDIRRLRDLFASLAELEGALH